MTKPVIEIVYCPRCRWLPRSAWMAQEILGTFEDEVGGVLLIPSETGGVFEIKAGETAIWSRAAEGRFPDITELKRRVRDIVAPEKSLGHVDRTHDE